MNKNDEKENIELDISVDFLKETMDIQVHCCTQLGIMLGLLDINKMLQGIETTKKDEIRKMIDGKNCQLFNNIEETIRFVVSYYDQISKISNQNAQNYDKRTFLLREIVENSDDGEITEIQNNFKVEEGLTEFDLCIIIYILYSLLSQMIPVEENKDEILGVYIQSLKEFEELRKKSVN